MVAVVFGGVAVEEDVASAALAETDAASMLEEPKTLKSVGTATAEETEGVVPGLLTIPVEMAPELVVEAPMTDTSVGAARTDVSVPDATED